MLKCLKSNSKMPARISYIIILLVSSQIVVVRDSNFANASSPNFGFCSNSQVQYYSQMTFAVPINGKCGKNMKFYAQSMNSVADEVALLNAVAKLEFNNGEGTGHLSEYQRCMSMPRPQDPTWFPNC